MIINKKDAAQFCEDLRQRGKQIVFTNGQRDVASGGYALQSFKNFKELNRC